MIIQPVLTASSPLEDISRPDAQVQQEVRKWLRTVTPKTLTEWINSLPKINPAAAAHQQLHALKLLDEIDMPSMQKFALLDALRAGAYQTVDALTSGFLGSASSLRENFKAIINQAMLLQGQLAACYTNVAITARLQGEQQLFIMGSALHRAMMDQYTMLSFYLQLHLSVPQQLWRQLHRLYKVAEDTNLLAHVMGDNVFASEQMLTIKQIYVAALLLGAARTTQMHAEDVALTAKCLKKWALQADLGKQPETDQPWQLAVDISGGNAAHFETRESLGGLQTWRYLHTRKLAAYLPRQTGTAIRLAERSVVPGAELLRHLTAAWSEFVERDNTRHSREDTVVSVVGFEALHYFLTGAMSLDQFMGEVRQPLKVTAERKLIVGSIPETFNFHTFLPADLDHLGQASHPWHEIRVVDESVTGYCLEWPLTEQGSLVVGGIVGVKESFAPFWKIGEVVWAKKTADGKVRTGIRTLGNEVMPLVAKIPQTAGVPTDIVPSFLLAADRELGTDKPTFLVPNVRLKMGEQVRVIQEGNEHAIQLLEPVKETPVYSQFDCAFIILPH